jgi:hypothetical protein
MNEVGNPPRRVKARVNRPMILAVNRALMKSARIGAVYGLRKRVSIRRIRPSIQARINWVLGGVLGFGFCLACHRETTEHVLFKRTELVGDTVAQVGDFSIHLQTLAAVQAKSELSTDLALEKLVGVHLLGRWAKNGGLALGRRQTVERALLARVLLEKIQTQVQEPSRPSDEEVIEATRSRWVELDRPDAVRVTHFVVRLDGKNESQARELAEGIQTKVKGIGTPKEFIDRALAVNANGFSVIAESLLPVTADGRVFQLDPSGKPAAEEGMYDRDFAIAASRLETPGAQSSIIRTQFGFHVLLLEERIVGHTVPLDERRVLLLHDILRRRARTVADSVLSERRNVTPPQVDRAALEWMGRVKVYP